MHPKDADGIANSIDLDQTVPSGAVCFGPALFAQTYMSHSLEFYCKTTALIITLVIIETTNMTQLKSTGRNSMSIPVWEQLATDQTDTWQVVPRHVFIVPLTMY